LAKIFEAEVSGVIIVTFQEILDSIDSLSMEEQTKLFKFVCQRQVKLGDETDYLLSSPVNAAHLQRSIDELKQGKTLEKELIDE
jgi:transcriptional regulator with AAA-type ATPase domain